MAEHANLTANCKIIADADGIRYRFFCDLSGLTVYTTSVRKDTWEEGLLQAWQTEVKANFNQCRKCGKWVCDTMYNADVLECVACAPWENLPSYCPHCGEKLPPDDNFCRKCGTKLRYGEVESIDNNTA